MIVKDECAVIERCLASVRPLIDCWSIVDTGSSDNTPAMIECAMAGIAGRLHHRPWVDFASNRNESLTLARQFLASELLAEASDDYLLLIDADETLVLPPDFSLPALSADAYEFEHRFAELRYARTSMIRAATPWLFRGVLHEYLEQTGATAAGLPGPWVYIRPDGARSRNPQKFQEDAALLERALAAEPENIRNWFYLGQSYRDAGELAQSLRAYRQRAQMNGWEEENWYTLFQIARLLEFLGGEGDLDTVRLAYLAAYRRRPSRAEPLVELARWHRLRGEFADALVCARAAGSMPLSRDRLFVDASAYGWRALDEWSISAWYCECFEEGFAVIQRLLKADPPASDRARIDENLSFYASRGYR